MNRTDGLVQRRNVAAARDGGRAAASDDPGRFGDDDDARAGEDGRDEGDSKETRLTLMEEVLMLGIKDKEVRALQAGR